MTLALALVVAAGEAPWETQRTDPILVKTRARPGSEVKEVWAEAVVQATPLQIQRTITDVGRYTEFMPYVTESRYVGAADPDGARYTYARMDLPMLSARDYVHKSYVQRDAVVDPKGVFQIRWFAVPEKLPVVAGVVRLQISEGSWLVTPLPGGKGSLVVYRVCVDPAGAVPAFAANRANTNGLIDTFANIEREAKKR